MHAPMKYVEKGMAVAANGLWKVFSAANKINQNPSFTPRWSDKPLLKSHQKTKPPLGWPRETDSLCPTCVREARQEILDGKKDVSVLLNEKVGEIKATITEKDGKIVMVKDCPLHGHFEDVMAIDTDFFKHLEEVFPGRDIRAHNDEKLHNHGSSTVKYGRGAVLTVDLTNRCNMMCDPCFMDANQVGFVHELTWEEIKALLDNALQIKPRRQMSVEQAERPLEGALDDRSGLFVRSDEADASRHALGDGRACLRQRERSAGARHLQRDALGSGPAIGLIGPAIMEHPLVAPLVAVFLQQRGNEGERRIGGNDRGFGMRILEALDDRRGILHAFALRRHDQRHQGKLGVFLEFGLVGRRARQPIVRDVLVAEIRAHLHRVRRQLRAEDAIRGGHQIQRLRRNHRRRPTTMTMTRNQKNA